MNVYTYQQIQDIRSLQCNFPFVTDQEECHHTIKKITFCLCLFIQSTILHNNHRNCPVIVEMFV